MRRYGFRRSVRRISALASVATLSLLLYGSAFAALGAPDGITDEAREIHTLYIFVVAMAAVVFLAVEGALVYALFRYRRKSSDELPKQTHGSNVLELIWTGIPVVIVVALFTFSFIVLNRVQEQAGDDDMTIEVTGFQYQWQFAYNLNDLGPNSDRDSEESFSIIGTAANEPELVMPVDEPVEFKLIAADVIHSFYVPEFLYKLDVIPGRDNRFTVTARETGVFTGQCAELCGVDHALMRFTIRIVERDEFDAWVEEQSGSPAVRQP